MPNLASGGALLRRAGTPSVLPGAGRTPGTHARAAVTSYIAHRAFLSCEACPRSQMSGYGRSTRKGSKQKGNARDKLHATQRDAAEVDAEARAAEADAEARGASARERATTAAEARVRSRELKTAQSAVRKRGEKRHQRECTQPPGAKPKAAKPKAAVGPKTRGGERSTPALPKDIGATAAGRHSAFSREGRSDAAAKQAAALQVRNARTPFDKMLRNGQEAKAAAVLGGLVRDPQMRPLLQAAGIGPPAGQRARSRARSRSRPPSWGRGWRRSARSHPDRGRR